MRLGGPVFDQFSSPAEWVAAVRKLGYRAAYCPVGLDALADTVQTYAPPPRPRTSSLPRWGAEQPAESGRGRPGCGAGQVQARWPWPTPSAPAAASTLLGRGAEVGRAERADYAPDTFDLIVATVRDIIDSVGPQRTYYTLEPMPWLLPDSVETYAALIRAVDRPRFGVHFDPVNLINSPARYPAHTALIDAFVDALGPQIRSVHIKDMVLHDTLTVHLEEVRPGLGTLDYPAMLRTLARLDPDLPLLVEHLPNEAEYTAAVAYLRAEAARAGFGAELGAAGRG
ncbi:MAG: TIM barrel protein [Caldilineaceae bacterium]